MRKRELTKMVPTINIDGVNDTINAYIQEVCDNVIVEVDIDNDTWCDNEDIHFNIGVVLEVNEHTIQCNFEDTISYTPTLEDITDTINYVKNMLAQEIIFQTLSYIRER